MKALLDTHTFLWAVVEDPRLPARVKKILKDTHNELFLSVASAWEITIKAQLGKLKLPLEAAAYIPDRLAFYGMEGLPIRMRHVLQLGSLPALHRDPFDRILIAQSQVEDLPMLTADPMIARYGVHVIW